MKNFLNKNINLVPKSAFFHPAADQKRAIILHSAVSTLVSPVIAGIIFAIAESFHYSGEPAQNFSGLYIVAFPFIYGPIALILSIILSWIVIMTRSLKALIYILTIVSVCLVQLVA